MDLHGLLSKHVIDVAAGMIGKMADLDEAQAAAALREVVPAVLGGLVQRASEPRGAEHLSRALAEADHSVLDDVLGFLGGNQDRIFAQGEAVVSQLFGAREPQVSQALSQSTGLSMGTIAKLLKIAAPLVLAYLARHKREKKLADRDLGEVVESQRGRVEEMLPKSIRDAIGLGERPRHAPHTRGAPPAASPLRSLLPVLLVAVLAFFAWRACRPKPEAQPEQPRATTAGSPEDVLVAAIQGVDEALGGASSRAEVERAVPVVSAAAAALDGLADRFGAMTAEQQALVRGVAERLPEKLEAWMARLGEIPGATDVVAPALLELGQAIDRLAQGR